MSGTEQRYKVRDISVRMRRAGSGPPLLFLHGANGLPAWLPVFDMLSKHFEVMVPEHPGFGAADNPAWIKNVGDLAMYYLDFLDSLGPYQVHLVGHSLGGWTAAELAVRNCSRLASLTLIAPAGIRVKGVPSGDNFIWSPEEAVRNLYCDQAVAERILATPVSDEDADLMLANRYAAAKFGWEPRWFNPSLERWLHRISVPTLVLWGDSDKLFPAAYAKRWGERVPGARIEIITNCGHVPTIERPEPVAQAIIRQYAGTR
jgi:pimeloyl-ACP methyl ester carboxylesterase